MDALATITNESPVESPIFNDLDHFAGATLSRLTLGFSPASILLATLDWNLHWAVSPGKRMRMALGIYKNIFDLWAFAALSVFDDEQNDLIPVARDDHRFQEPAWRRWPFRVYSQAFLLNEKWWDATTHNVLGVAPHHENMVAFGVRQWLDVFSPSNYPFTNPVILEKAWQTRGTNFIRGLGHLIEDVTRNVAGKNPAGTNAFEVGKTVAITPGKVIFQNHLIELIQYSPTTKKVYAEPILIVPAWIMKYYILDLSPQNSMIHYLVSQGHTVFCISWRNVTQLDRDVGLDDYRQHGVMEALDCISEILPERAVHGVGYCLGGTLLSIAAAAMAHADDHRLASITLFAAQTDFTEPGELQLFIDHSQIGILESMMWARGVLDSQQMAGAFQILQSNDLVWSRLVHNYLMGERQPTTDLMAWNADGTRMPFRMHSEYLRSLFLNNDLSAGRFRVDGHPVAIQNIRIPIFAVGTESDHIAPWRSVFKIQYLADTEITFVLTKGGHNAGIVSEPGHAHRNFRLRTTRVEEADMDADEWVAKTEITEGSWWPAWAAWLQQRSSTKIATPLMGKPSTRSIRLPEAPGSYILEH